MDPRQYLNDEEYPATAARTELGFQLRTGELSEYYWFNWIEPKRSLPVSWHQDDTHHKLGPVHLQVNDGSTAVDRQSARFVDSHPLDVGEQRLGELQAAIFAIEWNDGRPVGLDQSALSLHRLTVSYRRRILPRTRVLAHLFGWWVARQQTRLRSPTELNYRKETTHSTAGN